MSSNRTEELEHQAVLLSRQGMSARAISRTLKISRNTVKSIVAAHAGRRSAPNSSLPKPSNRRRRAAQVDAYHDEIARLLATYPEITAQRIFEELKARGFAGKYTQVKKRVRTMRPKSTPQISHAVEPTGPGEMAESDWSPYSIDFTAGYTRIMQAFGYALPYSHRKYYRFYSSSDLHALLDGHVQAFGAFGGAAHKCKYDGQKAVVLRWEGRQPIFNLRFIDFATYYEFLPVACRPGHPNDKPTVERSFWELEQSFFNGRRFRDEADLASQLEAWRTGICDLRPHKKSRRPRLELFAEETPHFRPLPRHPYDTARVVYRLCDIEGFIAWEGNRYSLPYEHVTDFLPVRITPSELFVYAADLHLIARHELRPKGAGKDAELPGHHPRSSRSPGPDFDQLRLVFDDLGHEATRFLIGLQTSQPRSAAYHARQILILRERYRTVDLNAALDHAARFGAFDHHAIERILRARAQPRTLDEYVSEATANKLAEVIAQSRTEPRSLVEYDALPVWPTPTPTQGQTPCPEPSLPEIPPTPHPTAELLPLTMTSSDDSDDTSSD